MNVNETKGESRTYLIFSDAEFDLIYDNQKEIDVEFTEEEKNFCFLSGKEINHWKRLEILSEEELRIGQTRKKKYKISQEDLDNFKL